MVRGLKHHLFWVLNRLRMTLTLLLFPFLNYHASLLSRVQLFVTPRTEPARLLCLRESPGKNTGVCCHALLQRIYPTQGSNLHLLHWRWFLLPLSHHRSPQNTSNNSKIQQFWVYQTKTLLHSKRNSQQNEKTTNGSRENICKYAPFGKGLIPNIYKNHIWLNSKKKKIN